MKITDIKPYPVWVGHRNQHIVKVETDEGIYGWGESGLSSRELASDATQPVGSHLYGCDGASRSGGYELRMVGNPCFSNRRIWTL